MSGTRTNPRSQAEITSNVRPDPSIASRMTNSANGGPRYPITGPSELAFKRGELAIAFRRPQTAKAAQRPGRSSECCFTSVNGLSLAHMDTPQDLLDSIYLVGSCNTDYDISDPTQPQNDLAVTRFGVVPTEYDMAGVPAYPGDLLMLNLPAFPGKDGLMGGKYGLSNRRPRNKLVPFFTPLDYTRTTDFMQVVFETMMSENAGVQGKSLDMLEKRAGKNLSAREQAALAMRQSTLFTQLQGINVLTKRGLAKIITPSEMEKDRAVAALLAALAAGDNKEDAYTAYTTALGKITETDVTRGTGMEYLTPASPIGRGNRLYATMPMTTQKHLFFKNNMHRMELSPNERMAARLKEEKDLLFLAHMAGAVGNAPRMAVQQDLLFSAYPQYATTALPRDDYMPDMRVTSDRTNSAYPRQYVKRSILAASMHAETHSYAKHCVDRTVNALSLSYSEGRKENDMLDVILDPRAH